MSNLRNGWNFHNDIASRLELDARKLMQYNDRPYSKIFDADAIEAGSFAEVMIILLRIKSKFESNDDIDEFVRKLKDLLSVSGHHIDDEKSETLYHEFSELLNKL